MQPQKFRNITLAAVALALGGRFIKQSEENHVVYFHVEPPPGLDLDDPDLQVPVQPLVAWTETLAGRLRARNRRIEGGPR